ncbi:LysR substrate-binding domain-containing protein [Thalassotalea sp. PLHSN55]|uniref:LysR family transcriptional regulator n=1 Tax=Thalassotalea sp. PLHSN55 TaxID=3435888 RepID=UPI003F8460FA
MNITIKQVRAFLAIANNHSFAEACATMHLSQPALSIAIKNLEEEVGGKLFVRSTRTLALTPEGDTFLPVAQRLLNEWDSALQDLNNHFSLNRGRLAIAAMPSFANSLLPEFLKSFRDQHPKINITIHDVIAEDAVEMVRAGKVELALTFENEPSSDLTFTPLFTDHFIVALTPKHALASKQNITWQAIANEPFIALQPPSNIRKMIQQSIAEQQLDLNIEFESNHLATIGQMVASGIGISIVPAICRTLFQAQGVQCRRLIEPSLSRNIGIITRKRYPLSSAAQAFFTLLESNSYSQQTPKI